MRHIASTTRTALVHHVHTLPLAIAIAMDDQEGDRTPPNSSASTAAVLLQLHDRDFLSLSFAKERLSNSFAFDLFVRNQASMRESKKKKKTQVDFSLGGGGGGVRSQPSNYAVYAPADSLTRQW